MVAVEDLVETAVEEEVEEEVGEPEAEGEDEVALKAAEAVEEEEDLKGETVRALDQMVITTVAADLHPQGQEEAEEEVEVLPVEARAEARAEALEISLIDECKTVPAEVVDRKMPRLAAPVVLTV